MLKVFKYTVFDNSSISSAIKKINQLQSKAVLVINHKSKKIAGTLSDGDLRRAFLKGINIRDKITKVYNKKYFYISEIPKDKKKIEKIFEKYRYQFIPLVDSSKKLKDIIFPFKKHTSFKKINDPVLVMAGGKGTRLKPFTEVLPKPLIPINNKTAISTIIDQFKMYKIKKFYISLNFKKEILESYLKYINKNKKYSFFFLNEKKPLGTAGPIKLLEGKIKQDFFVVNCDVIFNFDISNLKRIHVKNKNILTIVVTSKKQSIPYGVCYSEDGKSLKEFKEKIENEFNINIGLYLVNKKIFKYIKKNKNLDFDKLINILLKNNEKIGLYFIESNNWKDVGQWDNYNDFTSNGKKN